MKKHGERKKKNETPLKGNKERGEVKSYYNFQHTILHA